MWKIGAPVSMDELIFLLVMLRHSQCCVIKKIIKEKWENGFVNCDWPNLINMLHILMTFFVKLFNGVQKDTAYELILKSHQYFTFSVENFGLL